MSRIKCNLFGVPKITKDDRSIFFPYAKINALLYYILLNKTVSRNELAGLLWPEENERNAKKNLRNAIYQAKKSFDEEIIISPQKSFLILNDKLDIQIDTDEFLKNPEENTALYTGEFLQGFFLKEAQDYECWITKTRTFFTEKFVTSCYRRIENDIHNKNYELVEDNIKKLIEIDEYDERSFRLLMKLYQQTGRNGKAIKTYYDLSKLLRRDLGVDPDQKTRKIYELSLEKLNYVKKDGAGDTFFYGREEEIAVLEKTLNAFKLGKPYKSILITGETGIGKTSVAEKIIKNVDDTLIIRAEGVRTEENIAFCAWNTPIDEITSFLKHEKLPVLSTWEETLSSVFPNLDTLKTSAKSCDIGKVIRVVNEIIKKISEKKRVILFFEDIHLMDKESLILLSDILLKIKNKRIFAIMTSDKICQNSAGDIVTLLKNKNILRETELTRFSIESCHQFLEKSVPDTKITGKTLEKIYDATYGNPLFLREYAQMMRQGKIKRFTPKMKDAMQNEFIFLDDTAKKTADVLSYFPYEISLSEFKILSEFSDENLIKSLQTLVERNIITETEVKNDIMLKFSYPKLREYIYEKQAKSSRKLFHKKIADMLENMKGDKKNSRIFAHLVYHFTRADCYIKVLKYKIETLNYYLNFSHELFPIIFNEEFFEPKVYISHDKIEELFKNLENDFKNIKLKSHDPQDLSLLEIEFFYMKGRYSIRDGEYKIGTDYINYVIEKAAQIKNPDYMLEGYKQMIFYGIQTGDTADMAGYIERALDLAVKCNYHKEIGILLRLKGLYNLMIGKYAESEKLLAESISTLTVTEEVASRYAINIAAAYNYTGEIRLAFGKYAEALSLFEKAINLAAGKNALSSLSVFYINAGTTAYITGEIENAKMYFNKAYTLYGRFDSFWRRCTLDSYMALVNLHEKNYKETVKYIKFAKSITDKMKSPRDKGVVDFASYIITKAAQNDKDLYAKCSGTLDKKPTEYAKEALKNLNPYRDLYEIELIKSDKKEIDEK